jgi:hypothetical protein
MAMSRGVPVSKFKHGTRLFILVGVLTELIFSRSQNNDLDRRMELNEWLENKAGLNGRKLTIAIQQCQDGLVDSVEVLLCFNICCKLVHQ